MICHCRYHMSESCIDKLKRAAVRFKSLGGRYDPTPHTDHCDSGEGGKHPTRFENAQANLLLNEGDNRPFIFCACWDVPPQSNNTFIDSNFMQMSLQVCNSRGLLFTHFYLSICFECADSFPSISAVIVFHKSSPSFNPCWSPPLLLPTA